MKRSLPFLLLLFPLVAGAAAPRVSDPFHLTFTIEPGTPLTFNVKVTDKASGQVVAAPKVEAAPGESVQTEATAILDGAKHQLQMRMSGFEDGRGRVVLTVRRGERVLQRTTYKSAGKGALIRRPMTLSVKDADLREVLLAIGRVSGKRFDVAETLTGKVTVDAKNTPWDDLLDQIADEHGLKVEMKDNLVRVTK